MPISAWEALAFQGRTVAWLARATSCPGWRLAAMRAGRLPVPPELRQQVALLLGIPEEALSFDPQSRRRRRSRRRSGKEIA